MEEQYWKKFMASGKVEDYLYYKGMDMLQQKMTAYTDRNSGTGDRTGESDNSHGDGAVRHSYR